MKTFNVMVLLLAALAIIALNGCETREQSIERENGYISDNPPEQVAHYWRDVEYANVGGVSLTLDMSAPEGDGPFPVLMIIHGGGWYLHTNTVMEGMARYVTNRGYVVANVNYRVTPEYEMEQIVEDCIGALIWVKEHASEYKGDASRIAVTGDSAGGHLTAMIVTQGNNKKFNPSYKGNGATDATITCAIPTYGIYDLVAMAKLSQSTMKRWMKESYKKAPERYELLSPSYHIRADLVPQLVVVGDKDFLYKANLEYVDALKAVGAPVELWVYPGQSHAFLNNYWEENGRTGYDRILEFMDQELKK